MKNNNITGIEINEESKMLFEAFGKSAAAIHGHLLKHLNRYHKWDFYIPKWNNNKWENKFKVLVKEFIGVIDNRNAEKIMGLEPNKLGEEQYTIAFTVIDLETKKPIKQGLCKNRYDLWQTYMQNLRQALELRKNLTGCNSIIN